MRWGEANPESHFDRLVIVCNIKKRVVEWKRVYNLLEKPLDSKRGKIIPTEKGHGPSRGSRQRNLFLG